MPAPTFRYHAFISHRPDDNHAPGRRWADWLRHSLESFEVPPGVAGRRTPAGPVPSRLFPVFVEDGEDLTPAVREAIDQSRVMIVVCSPGAAQSPRVTEEIRLFKKTGRDRVIALIVAGEPDARNAKDECFPETLRDEVTQDGGIDREWRLHPLAADVRADGRSEGFTSAAALEVSLEAGKDLGPDEIRKAGTEYAAKLDIALARIIAGVLGVPPSELSKRDQTAQVVAARRRGRRGLVVALLFALIAGAAGYFGWREYDRRQMVAEARARADRLIGALGHDLREKLEPIGQLSLLADLNERVTSHLTLAVRDDDDPKLLAALATSVDDAVDIYSALADHSNALNATQLSLQIRERIAKNTGATPENTLRRVIMLRRSAAIFLRLNQQTAAFAQADAARTLGSELVRAEPGLTAAATETIWAHYEAGDILAELGKTEDARSAFNAGRELAARFSARAPGDVTLKRALAEGHARLGELLQQGADLPAAMAEFRDAEKIMAPLAASAPDDLKVQASLAFLQKRMGFALVLQRDLPAAIAQQRLAVQTTERLAKNEPSNKNLQYEHAEALRRLGDTLLQAGDDNRTEALTLIQQALDLLGTHFPGETDGRAARLRTDLEGLKKSAAR